MYIYIYIYIYICIHIHIQSLPDSGHGVQVKVLETSLLLLPSPVCDALEHFFHT